MVEVVGLKLVTHQPVIEPVSAPPRDAAVANARHVANAARVAPLSVLTDYISALTDLLAGLAANSIGSFVKGFIPLRASVADLFTTDILAKPGMANSPDSRSL
jgi:hypothetical protein